MLPSAVLGSLGLWAGLAGRLAARAHSRPAEAVLTGLLCVLGHWALALVHQAGHAWAAHTTGYPMRGVRLWGLLSTSVYPDNEPPLPRELHVRRALGGPLASLLLTLPLLAAAGAARKTPGLPRWLATFWLVDNVSVFFLGAFVPLPFTDGGTLLFWLRRGA